MAALLLAGCDQLVAQLGLPDPKKEAATAEADGRAIGSACRHSGRALEDCYALNPAASKASVFAGWREMNDYMTQNNLAVVPSHMPSPGVSLPAKDAAGGGHATPPPPGGKASSESEPAEDAVPPRRSRRSRDNS
ncbi:MAG: hypothetical protein JNJ44_02480 [Zoogloeaceae bacterium]|nr:hypothetical protein [Zoogloeaceae bacterium]